MKSQIQRRLLERPWTWVIAAVMAVAVIVLGLGWLDGLEIRTSNREVWAQRIIIVGGIGVLGVELARRAKWWLGVGAAILLVGFVIIGLNRVIDVIRMEEFTEGDRRALASGPPIDADVVADPGAAGLEAREAWNELELVLDPVVTGLSQPIAVEAIPDTDQYLVLQREGEIRLVAEGADTGETLVDLGDETTFDGERGFFDIAIGPADGRLYASFTDLEGDNRVVSFAIGDDAALTDRQEIIEVTQPFETHNGGSLEFDSHGYLLLGIGDGGRLRDSLGAGQDRSNRLATLVRIAPLAGGGYEIPPDNPYLDVEGAWPEIYAYGLRNPWRISTDSLTGDIWIGDVGQDAFEEVNRIPFGTLGGSNFGWSIKEGAGVHVGPESAPTGFTEADIPADNVDPTFFYAHDPEGVEGFRNSITGGYVYRGTEIPLLVGTYVYADFAASFVGAVLLDDGTAAQSRTLIDGADAIVSLGVDHNGELLLVSLSGEISRLTAP